MQLSLLLRSSRRQSRKGEFSRKTSDIVSFLRLAYASDGSTVANVRIQPISLLRQQPATTQRTEPRAILLLANTEGATISLFEGFEEEIISLGTHVRSPSMGTISAQAHLELKGPLSSFHYHACKFIFRLRAMLLSTTGKNSRFF